VLLKLINGHTRIPRDMFEAVFKVERPEAFALTPKQPLTMLAFLEQLPVDFEQRVVLEMHAVSHVVPDRGDPACGSWRYHFSPRCVYTRTATPWHPLVDGRGRWSLPLECRACRHCLLQGTE
jgi:hypothetical protein